MIVNTSIEKWIGVYHGQLLLVRVEKHVEGLIRKMLRMLRSKGKLYYKDLEVFEIEKIRKQSPIGIVIKVLRVCESWDDEYKGAIGELLPVEAIKELLNGTNFLSDMKVYIVKASHKLGGRWDDRYVKEV